MGPAVAVWNCRCGYSNTGPRRCAGCHRPSPSFRRQLRKRRLISAACLAATVTVSSAKWSPLVGQAAAPAPTPLPPPPPAPAPPPRAPAPPGPRAELPGHVAQNGPTRPGRRRQAIAAPRAGAAGPGSTAAEDRCLAARQAVDNAGDHLAAGFDYRCPDSEYPRWGATTMPPCGPCLVTINSAFIGPDDAALRYVVAHEFCHSNGVRDEQAADDCAAHYGFPNIYFTR
jgi:hypothetical protein